MLPLTNKTALITGATKGMGLAIAERLAHLGCNLLLSARNEETLGAIKMQLEKINSNIHIQYHACDVSDRAQLNTLVEWVKNTKIDPDILINNVGVFKPVSILDESDQDFERQMHVNYFTPHILSRAVGRRMRENRSGHIFNISSIASREPVSSAGTYTVTKYAVMGLTHILRDELRPYGVKVTEIIPGSTLTSSWEGTTIAAGQFILPADIAAAIVTCLQMSEGANVDEMVIKPKFGNL